MKNSLGKYLFFLLLVNLLSASEDFDYKFDISNSNPYIKEAITLRLDINQTDSSKVMLFKFDLKKSDEYVFWRVDTKSVDDYHAMKVSYTYLIYPLKDGEIKLKFNLIKMITTDDKVAYSFSGDRDNTRGLNKVDIPIKLAPLAINIKPIPKEVDIVGDFKIFSSIKQNSAKAYEPLPINITISGDGYPPNISNIIKPSQKYNIFSQAPIAKTINYSSGTKNSIIYSMALSAEESFVLDAITINAFNPKTNKLYKLTLPKEEFTITQPNISKLIDDVDTPKPIEMSWSWLSSLFGYIVVFIAGFLSAKSMRWRQKSQDKPIEDKLQKHIKSVKDPKELLSLLLSIDRVVYKDKIEELEKLIYKRGL